MPFLKNEHAETNACCIKVNGCSLVWSRASVCWTPWLCSPSSNFGGCFSQLSRTQRVINTLISSDALVVKTGPCENITQVRLEDSPAVGTVLLGTLDRPVQRNAEAPETVRWMGPPTSALLTWTLDFLLPRQHRSLLTSSLSSQVALVPPLLPAMSWLETSAAVQAAVWANSAPLPPPPPPPLFVALTWRRKASRQQGPWEKYVSTFRIPLLACFLYSGHSIHKL